MIRPDRIKSEIFGGVGWRQPINDGAPVIDEDNLSATGNLYYQDGNSFVTIQNINDCQQYDTITDEQLNDYLTQLQESAILEVCQKISENETDFIQSVNLFPYEKSFKNTIEPSGKFVGFQIIPIKMVDMLSQINWIELAFDSVKTFNIHLYNSNLPGVPIKTQPVTTVANSSVIVSLTDWFIADGETFKGGTFYLGYFEDDLDGAKAIKRDYELSEVQVTTRCNYITPAILTHSGAIIDITTVSEKSQTYGLNFGMDIYNDYSELFIRNKSQLYQVIQYQMAEKVFGIIRSSVRSNITQRINKDNGVLDAYAFELYGNREAGIIGITGKLKRAVENLKKTFFYKPLIQRKTLR